MSVQQLHEPEAPRWVSSAREAVQAARVSGWSTVGDAELSRALTEVVALEAQAAGLRLQVLAEVDSRRPADQTGDTGTDAWAARLTGTTRGVMAGGLWLARLLEERYAATRRALVEGGVSEAQARVIVRAAEQVPAGVSDEERAQAEVHLVSLAVEGLDPTRLRQRARRMLEVVSAEHADQHEADLLTREERRAEVETWLTLHDNADGTFSGRFVIPELHGHLLRHALERLTSPERLSRNGAGKLVHDPTVPGEAPRLSWSEARGAAFLELLEHLPTEGLGGVGASLLVTIPLRHLRDGLASAGLDTGARISAGEARRLACGAGLVPAVLGGRSEALDLGRQRRLHTPTMRRALALRHDSCAAEGCERPFAWCDVHHPHAWSRGGGTSVDNALPLCGHHHRRAHDPDFHLALLASGEARFRRRRRARERPRR